jgi:hypothetical protein
MKQKKWNNSGKREWPQVPAVNDAYHSAGYERFSLLMKGTHHHHNHKGWTYCLSLTFRPFHKGQSWVHSIRMMLWAERRPRQVWEKRETEIHTWTLSGHWWWLGVCLTDQVSDFQIVKLEICKDAGFLLSKVPIKEGRVIKLATEVLEGIFVFCNL